MRCMTLILNEAQYDGFYGVCTNLEDSIDVIIRANHQRWKIEETFRIMKSEFKARPTFVRRDDRIRAHFLTCFIAMLAFRIIESRLDHQFSCHKIIQTLREMKWLELSGEGFVPTYERTILIDKLHDAFGFRTDYQLINQKTVKKIIKKSHSIKIKK